MKSSDKRRAFTLVEIMIVVTIIAILSGLVIPQMLRSRMSANEAAAIAALRTISNACLSYYSDVIPHAFPETNNLVALAVPNSNPAYIDAVLANADAPNRAKQGYYFSYVSADSEHFSLVGWPADFGRSGGRNFFVNQAGTITYNSIEDQVPTEDDLPIQ
ncbi:MAG: prepilin-type N-terminal cleavage/methylation domain-containing protein [Candidatus Omnitrophica bacterium]|nr:prepilin-type N-terminal cleavage/methylation domain-containing protein [Candidatus Omnitrophota bacterium]